MVLPELLYILILTYLTFLGSSSLEELEEKLINSQFYVPRTRKSLVKGERFIRYV